MFRCKKPGTNASAFAEAATEERPSRFAPSPGYDAVFAFARARARARARTRQKACSKRSVLPPNIMAYLAPPVIRYPQGVSW